PLLSNNCFVPSNLSTTFLGTCGIGDVSYTGFGRFSTIGNPLIDTLPIYSNVFVSLSKVGSISNNSGVLSLIIVVYSPVLNSAFHITLIKNETIVITPRIHIYRN